MLSKCLLLLMLAIFIEAESSYSPYLFKPCITPRLEHGRVRMKQRARLVKFMCAPRYELVGDRYATCRGGRWDVPTPVCVKPGCGQLPVSPNSIQVKEHRDAWVVTFCLPGHRLDGSAAVYCDGFAWNSTAPTCVDSSQKQNLSCDFEEPSLCGWTQDELHDFDWKQWSTRTPSYFVSTGPSYDHTFGKQGVGSYMYIESTARNENDTARLLSPVYDFSLTQNGCFSFFYHMYGKDIGGLRVYQKPISLQLYDALNLTGTDQKYLLFEQWGNQGDIWYGDVSQLITMDEDFQIVIEGIRGATFISDIAIDDVSILTGDKCAAARLTAVRPAPPDDAQTCMGRCDLETEDSLCGCTIECVLNRNCCPDYIDKCIYSDDVVSPTETLPETQKLVGETTTTTSITTTFVPTTTFKPTTISKPTTTFKPITPKPTTTFKPTTTNPPTTFKPTTTKPATTFKPTITKPTTTFKPTTTKPATTFKPTTTKPTTTFKSTTSIPSTTTKPTTVKPTTREVIPPKVNTIEVTKVTPIVVTTASAKENMSDDIEKKKEQAEINLNKMGISKQQSQSKSSSLKTAIIIIVFLALFASLVYVAVIARSARGRQAVARLRGRANHDSEVRYLNSCDDDL